MKPWISMLLGWGAACMLVAAAGAQSRAADEPVWVCPAQDAQTHPPQPSAQDCAQQPLWTVDPQGRHLWVLADWTVTEAEWATLIGLQVSAKAASEVYLNGVRLGANGRPADRARDELAGRMDVVLPIAPGSLQVGVNRIALRMSSHQGWMHLSVPVHGVGLVPYSSVQDHLLRHYLPTLLPLGAFVLACCYFLSLTVRSERTLQPALLSLLALLAALQLLLEISRGLVAYAYPWHDLRLIGILVCAVGFGLCLVTIIILRFAPEEWRWRLGSGAALTLAASVLGVAGMDGKASVALLLASAWSAGVAAHAWRKAIPHAGAHAAALGVFGMANGLTPELFLDRYFFLLVAGLLVFLMVQQAFAHAREQQQQRAQRARADRLQAALEASAQTEQEVVLSIPSVGRVQRIPASRIAHIQGAGDYAELHLISGESVLHATGLNALEAELPSYFLRVHRSHLVNTRLIERLQQGEGGTGVLHLQHGHTVPVSRRIMPGVRKALR